jgi:hypothetical protein
VSSQLRLALAFLAMLEAGCVTPAAPVAEPPEPVRTTLPAREHTLERDYRARSAALMKDGRWADAKVQWELLLLLNPGSTEYRSQLDVTRRRIDDAAAEANAHAATARRRGDLETATTQFLRALAADRENPVAIQGLREIERDRTRRAYLNRPPRSVPGVTTEKPGAPVELEHDYMQRHKPGNGDDEARTLRR